VTLHSYAQIEDLTSTLPSQRNPYTQTQCHTFGAQQAAMASPIPSRHTTGQMLVYKLPMP
jgi:hypothetical protein